MPRNSQDRTSLFPAPTCFQCLITTAQEGNAADLTTADRDKEVKHSILTPAQTTHTPRLGTVPLRGLTRGQPIKLLAIKLHGLNAALFFFFLDPGVWWIWPREIAASKCLRCVWFFFHVELQRRICSLLYLHGTPQAWWMWNIFVKLW